METGLDGHFRVVQESTPDLFVAQLVRGRLSYRSHAGFEDFTDCANPVHYIEGLSILWDSRPSHFGQPKWV